MKIINKLKFAGLIMALLAIAAGSSSCRKEYIDKYNTQTVTLIGDNHINSFAVKEFSDDTTLYATIKNDSIIVYWPGYKAVPATIRPIITLPDSASISPASGEAVAFETGVTYIVTSGANTVKTYKLVVSARQQIPSFTYPEATVSVGQRLNPGIDFFVTDTALTKVFFIGADTKTEYKADLATGTSKSPIFFVPNLPNTEKYDLKIINGFYTLYNTNAAGRNGLSITTSSSASIYNNDIPPTLKAGDIFTIRAVSGHLITVLQARLSSNNTYYNYEIIESKTDRIIVKVPDTIPRGVYNRFQGRNSTGGTAGSVAYSFTITE